MDDQNGALADLFTELGFHVAATTPEAAVPEDDLREALRDRYYDAVVSRYIFSFPPLFVLHQSLSRGAFFVRVASERVESRADQSVLENYIPDDILVVEFDEAEEGLRQVQGRWQSEDRDRMRSLVDAIADHFDFSLTDDQRNTLKDRGWIV